MSDVQNLVERLRQIAEGQRMDFDSPNVAATLDDAAMTLETLAAIGSVVSEEPEWEYGIVAEAFGGEPDPHPSYEAAAHVRDNTKTLYRKWTHGSEVAIFRRRKAGPWLPVEQEGEIDEE